MPERLLDTRGLSCPLPVLKARKALQSMAVGDDLVVLASDPKAPRDLAELCAAGGHRLASSTEQEGTYRVVLVKA